LLALACGVPGGGPLRASSCAGVGGGCACRRLMRVQTVEELAAIKRARVLINLYITQTPRTSLGSWSLIRLLINTWEDRVKANLEDVAAEQGFLVEEEIEES